jgi:hypothetical protein
LGTGHESKRGTTREVEGEGKGEMEKGEIRKNNRREYDQRASYTWMEIP